MDIFSGVTVHQVGLSEDDPLVKGWLAAILSEPSAWRAGLDLFHKEFDEPEMLDVMGINLARIRRRKTPPQKELQEIMAQLDNDTLYEANPVYQNARLLVEPLGLSEADVRLLTFLTYMTKTELVRRAAEYIGARTTRMLYAVLRKILRIDRVKLESMLHEDAILFRSGLVSFARGVFNTDLSEMFSLRSDFASSLSSAKPTAEELLSVFYETCPPSILNQEDLTVDQTDLEIIYASIGWGADDHDQSTNILLYGAPGCGKTELARYIANAVGVSLLSVSSCEHDNRRKDRISTRLGAIEGCRRLIGAGSCNALLVDEAEDILCDRGFELFGMNTRDSVTKSELVTLLEEIEIPTIWITNTLRGIDPALLRRFSYVLEVKAGSQNQRMATVRRLTKGRTLPDHIVEQIAQCEQFTPALLKNAVRAADNVVRGDPEGVPTWTKALVSTLEVHLKAQGHSQRFVDKPANQFQWNKAYVNTDADIDRISNHLRTNADARFCLYGPPGTGKTQWARELARKIEKPLVCKQASDLQGPYVGETEKLIAQAFEEAADTNAVLLIDEADSFLDARSHARQSWEVSRTNQFLTSMERHNGIFIATTNFLDRMDSAAMRRFDYRVEFHPLDSDQSLQMLRDICVMHGLAAEAATLDMLQGLEGLTPGDFAALQRRLSLESSPKDTNDLIRRLRQDVAYKQPDTRPIGFVH